MSAATAEKLRIARTEIKGLRNRMELLEREASELADAVGAYLDRGAGGPGEEGLRAALSKFAQSDLYSQLTTEPKPMSPQQSGVELILLERLRQIQGEGWNAAHDDEHTDGGMADAAACYASLAAEQVRGEDNPCADREPPIEWPWETSWWKPKDDPIRNLVRAGALIAAEIDRLQREKNTKGASA